MLNDRQSLTDEINRLEKELESQHFRGLFDQRAQHKTEKRLKKLRRELAELDGTAVTQTPFRKPDVEAEPRPVRQPKIVKPPLPATRPAAVSKASKTPAPAKPASRPAAKPKAPAAKKKSPSKSPAASKPAAKPRKKSR